MRTSKKLIPSLRINRKKSLKSDVHSIARPKNIPRHIAIIMDGNGRWAKSQKLTRLLGHKKGANTVREIVTASRDLGVSFLTLYAFSEENWNRPRIEIKALMKLLQKFLISERDLMKRHDIRLLTIGNIQKLPFNVRKTLSETLELTKNHQSMSLVLALSYGGREEITRAVQTIAQKVAKKEIRPTEITQEMISAHLDTADMPDPDLIIRTSGEWRTSNYLPWQSIYSELYVTPTLWPNFSKAEFYKAIEEFGYRERRFGLISEQLLTTKGKA